MSKIQGTEENLEHWISTGIDLVNRRIDLSGDVDETMRSQVLRAVLQMENENIEPISIYLSSQGGEVYSSFAIYDFLRTCKSDIHMYASGCVMSAAVVIYLAGDKRMASENTSFMIHSMSSELVGKVKDQEIDVLENKKINAKMLDILVKRAKITKKLGYRKIASSDWYLSVEEAKVLKIVNS